ncbi:uncharacterized protein [Drosophila tropicalis]|uniref:uncharacterized protein n=1 Tax=Drosophila tropicalis TaxID=46794 RepID=UPI0035ABBAF1
MPETDVNKMKVADLKRELKLRGLPVNGNKNELADRLQTALLEGSLSLEDSAINDDALDGDDDVLLTDEDEHKLLLDEHEDELLKSPVPTSATLLQLGTDKAELESPSSVKKIVLKRTNSQLVTAAGTAGAANTSAIISKENAAPEAKPNEEKPAASDATKTDETPTKTNHKPIVIGRSSASSADTNKKLSELSIQERLALRAKKFGITESAVTAVATAINKSSSASIVSNKGNKETDEEQKEALKRRAERFGCVVPEKTSKTATDDRLQKRKERFGLATESSVASTGAATKAANTNYSEKALARLERFKTTSTTPSTATPTTIAGTK